jgi:hypothetical protein
MIVQNQFFEGFSISIIVVNSIFLAMQDPTASEQAPFLNIGDYVFQALYTTEMLLKICSRGFIFNKGSYLRNYWNILDFVIVVSGFASYLGTGTNLNALRSFRVLRPLRSISVIEGLRVIVSAMMLSLALLRDAIIVLLFFYSIMSIIGV